MTEERKKIKRPKDQDTSTEAEQGGDAGARDGRVRVLDIGGGVLARPPPTQSQQV